jgi:hypothetical protein
LNIGCSSTSIIKFAGADPADLINKLYDLLGQISYPQYLQKEALITTVRTGNTFLGAINPSHILKLTSKRLLDLKVNNSGGLEINITIDLKDVINLKVIKNSGENNTDDIYELKFKMRDNSKHKYTLGSVYADAINLIELQLNPANVA